MNDGYVGRSSNSLVAIASDDYTTNSSKLVATTKCVNDAIDLNKLIVDNKTTNIVAGEVVVKDILFNNLISLTDSGALGKARYISSSQSFNIDTDDFDLVVINASSENSSGTYPPFPGFLYIRQFYYSRTSPTVIGNRMQVAFAYNANRMWRRYHLDGSWSAWVKVIDETDLATVSTPGIVQLNNTTSSTSTTQAATANAVKIAYDKAVAAYTKAESAQGSSASADKLTTARTIQTNLASTASASFDGTENVTPGVTGVLPTANGGTGRTDGKAPSLVTKRTIDGVSFDGSANIHHYGTCSTDAGTATKTVTLANFVLATGAEVTVRFTVTNTASNPTLNVNNTGAKPIQYRNAAISAGYLAANRTYRFVYDGSNYELVGDVDINTTYVAASATPKAPGTAAVGTSGKYAREDHVHPLQTTVSGNAGSATKLATARTIDGVSFNGTANITHFGVCSTEAATAAKTVSVSGFTLVTGAEVTVQFTVTNTAASPTLNVNSTGAKAIVYRNAAISAGYLAANRVYKFVYDGTNYELIGDIDTNNKYTAASATPKAPGTAAVGTSSKYAREDHIHPLQTTVSGNAGTATKLATARTISLTGVVEGSVSFDGSKNVSITTTADGIGGSIPIGGIIAFSGTFGGTNNRFPIPLGSTTPDTNWCLCDGTKTNNLNVPDLRGRMILGASSTYAAGSTGGSATHTHSISGTVGATTLSTTQMPSHSHSFSALISARQYYLEEGYVWGGGSSNTSATGGSGSHTHSLSNTSTTEEALLPPYYSLSYIIRIS